MVEKGRAEGVKALPPTARLHKLKAGAKPSARNTLSLALSLQSLQREL